jgi:hypothetical protein
LSKNETAPVRHVGFSLVQRISIVVGAPLFYLLHKKSFFLQTLSTAGEMSRFLDWQQKTFSDYTYSFNKRSLYKSILAKIKKKGNFSVLEFGTAHGEKTKMIAKNTIASEVSSIHSFDRFTGLPRSWRDMDEGAFTNHGKFPRIFDERILWYKGNVEETIHALDVLELKKQLFVIFDLDLFEPTIYLYNFLEPYLKPGDIVYFDEAFDPDENKVLMHFLDDFQVHFLGTTGMAICFEVDRRTREFEDLE